MTKSEQLEMAMVRIADLENENRALRASQGEPIAWVDEKAEVLKFGGWEARPFAKSFKPVFYATSHADKGPK